jgi:hypothetical protein
MSGNPDSYIKVPLACLSQGRSPEEAFALMLGTGLVNAAIGYRHHRGEERYQFLLEQAQNEQDELGWPYEAPEGLQLQRSATQAEAHTLTVPETEDLWDLALVGSYLLELDAPDPQIHAQHWLDHHRPKAVLFNIRLNFLRQAWELAHQPNKLSESKWDLSWRNFRVLAAILSAQLNRENFCFLGWETLQARACGFHTKALLAANRHRLPAHCQPLSRDQIRLTTASLELQGFFARVRYAAGARGGYMAYSVRHSREELTAAVLRWRDSRNQKHPTLTAHRQADRLAFAKSSESPTTQPELEGEPW